MAITKKENYCGESKNAIPETKLTRTYRKRTRGEGGLKTLQLLKENGLRALKFPRRINLEFFTKGYATCKNKRRVIFFLNGRLALDSNFTTV